MSFTTVHRRTAAVLIAVVALWGALAIPAFASNSTITRADCLAGRISKNGKPISTADCLRHVGQSVKLAHTGFDVWIVALAGGACLAGAVALRVRRPVPKRGA